MKYKILLFHYVGGAGGKFIANCLCMSEKVAFSNFKISKQFFLTKDFKILEKALLDTIPPKTESRTWFDREQGCSQLFGDAINNIKCSLPIVKKLNDLSELGDVWLPLVSHKKNQLENCLKYFSNCTVKTVLVNGTKEFIDKSIRLKWPEKHHCLDLETYNLFQKELVGVDFDYKIHNWDPLQKENRQQISELAKILNINFDINSAKFYIDKYLDFYKR